MKNNLCKFFVFCLFVLIFLGNVGCSSKTETEVVIEPKSTVKSNLIIEEYKIPDVTGNWGYPTPYGLIPRGPGFIRMSYVFDSLIWKDKNGDFIPALAKKWEYNEDENSYIFELNENAKWHDGDSVTSKDIIFTIDYMKEHPVLWLDLKSIEEVVSINDYKVKFKLKEKWAPFYATIAGSMPILPEHIYKDIKDPQKDLSKKAVIGSGPFTLNYYNAEKGEYIFEAFEDYYQGSPKVKKLKFFKMNSQMQPKALLKGEVDGIFTNGDTRELFEDSNIDTISSIGMVTKVLFNHNKSPFDDKEFRHAIAYSIDSDKIIEVAHRGHAFKGYSGIISDQSEYFEKGIEQYNYNDKKAMEIFEKLGYKKIEEYYEKNGEILTFNILGSERVRRDVDIIVEQLNKIGIKTKAIYKDTQMADQMLKNWEFDIAVVEGGAIGDPIFLNRNIIGKGFSSDRYYASEKLINMLNEQLTVVDFDKRKNILKDFQKLYAEELPAYHIYYSEFIFAYNDKLDLYFTQDGISIGIPLALNKMIFIK